MEAINEFEMQKKEWNAPELDEINVTEITSNGGAPGGDGGGQS